MGKLLVYLKGYIKETVLAPLFKMIEACFELIVPLVVASIIDVGIANGDTRYVMRMCLIMAGLGLAGLVCSVTAQYFSAKAAVSFTAQVRRKLFEHIQNLSYTEIDEVGTSTLITRLTSDMNQVQNGVNLTLRLFLRSPFIVFGAMIMAFTIDTKSALVFVAEIILLSIVVFGIMLGCIPLYNKIQGKLDGVLGITRDNLSGVRVIRAFCKENEEIKDFEKANDILTALQKFTGKISALMNPLTFLIINAAIIILIYIGAIQVNIGLLTQGAVVALYNYMSQILVELIKLANLIINITKSVACGNRIQAVLEIEPSVKEKNTEVNSINSKYIVELNNACLRYKNSAELSLSNINLKVKAGETVGIIGGTGSGKTSLVNIIARFYDVEEGEVLVNGVNVKNYPTGQLRQLYGIVPQKAVLFKGSIRENMQWGKKDATDEEICTALKTAQAMEIVDRKDGGLDYVIEQGGKNLSGGQRQRLTIARALVGNPQILILDDSSSALDYATDAALRKSLREMKNSPAIFIVSQRTSSIRHADKIIVLDDGEAVGIGSHEELLESCPIYKEINDSQFSKEGNKQ
ncbi:MAG: ABC transporter ATP-binding protein/permease [Lachnospiraceae bacterium]|nr:ABC transporter ATP-binding protein/permease [Lachnospiraceae bacterium]